MRFESKVAKSFKAVKNDVEQFRQSMNDWIVFLDHNQRESKTRIRELERRLRILEAEKEIKDFENF